MTPANFFRTFINTHEGGLSLDTADRGNWHGGKLVGSKFGVTGDALAKHRKVPLVTAAEMKALTIDEAIEVGLDAYYRAPGFDKLPFNRVIMAAVDHGYNAGPKRAIEILQRLIGSNADGQIGPNTVKLFDAALQKKGEQALAGLYADGRIDYYNSLHNAKYIKGWTNRANSFRPGTSWWRSAA